MIYSFGAKNYFSFKDGFDISFELNSKVPKSISKGRKVSTVMGVKGANASGKTSILKALECLAAFCTRSFQAPETRQNMVSSFFGNDDPCEFYIEFEMNGVFYIYEASITRKEVVRETLYKKISRKTKVFERKHNELVYRITELEDLDLVILKNNSSIIDSLSYYKLNLKSPDVSNVYEFFNSIRGNVSALGVLDDKTFSSYESVNDFYYKVPEALEFAKKIIIQCDLGVSDIKMYERKNERGEAEYFPIFYHAADSEQSRALSYYEESHGTTALYRRLQVYWSTLKFGGTLVMDEFDTNLHPDLLPIIVGLFLDLGTNPKSAQFIFTSHNLEIIDYLGKYRTTLVSKVDGESFCYRLDEIPGDIIRNDRPISSLYRDGKIGGVPKL